jgi:hypothetical protein
VTIIIVHEPGVALYYVLCLETDISRTRLIRAWKRRHWIEYCFRTLKHLLATGACRLHNEDAYYGHLVLRLMGCFVLFYTSRVICKGWMTMETLVAGRWLCFDTACTREERRPPGYELCNASTRLGSQGPHHGLMIHI